MLLTISSVNYLSNKVLIIVEFHSEAGDISNDICFKIINSFIDKSCYPKSSLPYKSGKLLLILGIKLASKTENSLFLFAQTKIFYLDGNIK